MPTEAATELVLRSIGLGLALSLAFSETLGLAAGGMVVPGYMALMIHHPLRIVGTILVSLATYFAGSQYITWLSLKLVVTRMAG